MKGFNKNIKTKKKNIINESNENPKLSKTDPSKAADGQVILLQAIQSHSRGDIEEAIKGYQQFLDRGFKDKRVLSNYGALLHQKGDFQNAVRLYEKSISIYPDNAEAYCNLGIIFKDLGKPEQAYKYLKKAVEVNPFLPSAQTNLGAIQMSLGQVEQAEISLKKGIELNPNNADSYANLSTLMLIRQQIKDAKKYSSKAIKINPLLELAHINLSKSLVIEKKLDEAEKSITNAIEINNNNWDSLNLLGVILKEKRKFREAESYIRKSIKINPNFENSHYQLSSILFEQNKVQEAETSLRKAIDVNPRFTEAHFNLGAILIDKDKLQEALFHTKKAINLMPSFGMAYSNCGLILQKLGDLDEAEDYCKKAITLQPKWAMGYINLGIIFLNQGKLKEAKNITLQGIDIQPNIFEGYFNLSSILLKLGELEKSISVMENAIKINPNNSSAYLNLGISLKAIGEKENALNQFKKALEKDPLNYFCKCELITVLCELAMWEDLKNYLPEINCLGTKDGVISPFKLLHLADDPKIDLLRATKYYDKNYRRKSTKIKYNQKEKIHIGYFSADFRDHPVMHLLAGILESHNKSKFKIFIYSFSPKKDKYTQRVQASECNFRDIYELNDFQAVDQARKDDLDIAVDLNGYTENNRMNIFAYRVAPVQINYLGSPMSSGSSEIDYMLADEIVIPNENKSDYSEEIIYLPNCYMCFDRKRKISNIRFTRSQFGLKEDAFVLAAFHRSHKITPIEIDSWARLLTKIPKAILWIGFTNSIAKTNLTNCFTKVGIDKERIIFADRMNTSEEHLSRHSCADLFLDTINYNAQSTAIDSLWCGLPIVTLQGKSFSSRVCSSLLKAIKLENLIGYNLDDYEKIVIELSKNSTKLDEIKKYLKVAKNNNPIFNTLDYTVNLENIYTSIVNKLRIDNP